MGFTGAPSVPGKCPSCPRFGASAQPLFVEGFIRDAQGDRVVTVTTASYRLDVIEDGRIAHSIRRDIPPTRLTDQLRGDDRAAVQRMPLPDSTPAIPEVIADASNRVWARHWRGYWKEHEVDVYDVVDVDGRWLGWVEVPTNLGQLRSIGQDHMLFAWMVPVDVPRVRRHRVVHLLE